MKFKVYNGERFAELEGFVDTGAIFMKIPKSVASGIGLQAKYRVEVMLGNGRTVTKVTKQGKFAKRLRRGIVQVVG